MAAANPSNLLYTAAERGDLAGVQQAIASGGDPNAFNVPGKTPFQIAAENGHIEVMRFLIQNGADPNLQSRFGFTPLNKAVNQAKLEVIQTLLENGAEPNEINPFTGETVLFSAISYQLVDLKKSKEMVKMLLNHGVNPDLHGYGGEAPLHMAVLYARQKDLDVFNILLEKAKNINQLDHIRGETPLHVALEGLGNYKLAEALLKAGANPNIPMRDGKTPLTDILNKSIKYSTGRQHRYDIAKLLIMHRAEISDETAMKAKAKQFSPELNELIAQKYILQKRAPFAAMYYGSPRQTRIRETRARQAANAAAKGSLGYSDPGAFYMGLSGSSAAEAAETSYEPFSNSESNGNNKLGGAYRKRTRKGKSCKSHTRKHRK
jgi:ankyrin repeat protein